MSEDEHRARMRNKIFHVQLMTALEEAMAEITVEICDFSVSRLVLYSFGSTLRENVRKFSVKVLLYVNKFGRKCVRMAYGGSTIMFTFDFFLMSFHVFRLGIFSVATLSSYLLNDFR